MYVLGARGRLKCSQEGRVIRGGRAGRVLDWLQQGAVRTPLKGREMEQRRLEDR